MRSPRGTNLRAVPVAPGSEAPDLPPDQNQPDAQSVNNGVDDLMNMPDVPLEARSIAPNAAPSDSQSHGDDSELDALPSAAGSLGHVYNQVQHMKPDNVAEVLDASQKTGQDPSMVAANLPAAKQAAAAPSADFFKDIEDRFPGTTKYLQNPKNMALAHDDIGNLAKHEQLVKGVSQAMDLAGYLRAGWQASVIGLKSRGEMPDTVLPEDPTWWGKLAATAAGLAGDSTTMAAGGAAAATAAAPIGFAAGGATGLAIGGVPAIPLAAGGALAAAAIAGGAGAFAAPAAMKEYFKQKYTEGDIKGVADALDRGGRILKEATKQGLVGGLTAAAGGVASLPFELAEQAGAKAILPSIFKNKSLSVLSPLAAEDVTMTKAGNAVEGKETKPGDYLDTALLIGAMHGMGKLGEVGVEHYVEAKKTAQAVEFYDGLGEAGGVSKLLQRLPPEYRSMVGDLTKDSPVENVHIPHEAWTEYFQSQDIDPDQAADELGVTAQYEEAKRTGGSVAIPTADFVSQLVKTEHYQGLKNDIKFDPEGFTVNEIKARQKEIQEQIKQAETNAQNAPEDTSQKIYDERHAQLTAAGVSASEAKQGATLHQEMFKALAERTGQDPYELSQKFQLELKRHDEAQAQGRSFNQDDLAKHFEGPEAIQKYIDMPETKNGTHLDVDLARKLVPEIAAGKEGAAALSDAVQEHASAFIKRMYDHRLASADKGHVHILSGGSGAGKSTYIQSFDKTIRGASAFVDTTNSNYDSAKVRLEKALNTGRKVLITHIFRDFNESLDGNASRYHQTGRLTPAEVMAHSHVESLNTFLRLKKEYKDIVDFEAFESKHGEEPQNISFAKLDKSRYNDTESETAVARLTRVAEGRLKNEIAEVRDAKQRAAELSADHSRVAGDVGRVQGEAGSDAEGRGVHGSGSQGQPGNDGSADSETGSAGSVSNPEDLKFSPEEKKSFEQSGLDLKRDGNVLDATDLFRKKEDQGDDRATGKVIVRDGEYFVRTEKGEKFHIEDRGERHLGKEVRFHVNENDSAIEIIPTETEDTSMLEKFKARFRGDEKIENAIDRAQSKGKAPYVETRAIKNIGWSPNFEAEPTGVIGREGIQEPNPKKGHPDPFMWADDKYNAAKDLLKKHQAENKPVVINTSSDLIGKADYIEAMPKDTTVNMYLLGKKSEQNRALFPGNASRLRQDRAVEKLREAGVKVNAIEPSVEDLIKAAGGEKEVAKKLGVEPAQVQAEIQKSLGLRLVKNYDQASRGRIGFQDGKAIIQLFKDADRSTFLHESGHYFLEIMQGMAQHEGAPEQIKNDMQAIREWMGLKDGEKIGTEQHEQFARGFEAYLREGVAPSDALRQAFSRFKQWLVQIYKSVRSLHVELSPEIREVMDRMLATDEQIQDAKRTIGHDMSKGMLVPESLKDHMNSLADQARDKAESTLMREQMKEISAANKAFLAGEQSRLQSEGEDEAEKNPVFKAQNDIQEAIGTRRKVLTLAGKVLDGSIKPQDEIHFEIAAEVHGFTDGKSLANEILASAANGAKEKIIEAHVEKGMAPHASLMERDSIKTEALRAIHNEHMTELLALERQLLAAQVNKQAVSEEVSNRQRAEAKIQAVEAKAQAKQILDDKPIKDAGNFRIYTTAERNAAVKADAASKREDYAKAAEYKRQQMLNHALAAEALRNRDESRAALKTLDKAASRDGDLKNMPYAFNRQIDQLLQKFGLKEKSPESTAMLSEIANKMLAKGDNPYDIANATGMVIDPVSGQLRPETLQDFINRQNENYSGLQLPASIVSGDGTSDYKTMKMSDLRDLKDAVKTITSLGKNHDRFLNDFIKIDMKEAAALFKKGVTDLIGSGYAGNRKIGESKQVDNIKNLPDAMIPTLVNVLTLSHYLDGGENGPAHDYIYRPLKQAEDRKFARYAKMREDLRGKDGLFGQFYTEKELAGYKNKVTEIDGKTITKENILSMALNWGNESNRDRIRQGFGSRDGGRLVPMSEDTIQGLFKHLDKKDWDFAQKAWDYLDTYWPDIAALEMKVKGVEPERVQSAPFENEHGSYRGGYYPVAYDFEKSSEAFANEQAKTELYKQYSAAAAQTDRGHTIARAAFVARPVRLSLDVLFNHLENVVHDLEFRSAIIDTNKFLNMPDVKNTLEDGIGMKASRSIGDWLKAQGSDQSENLTYYEKAINWSRFGTTMASLGFKPAMLLLHGPSNVFHGIWEMGVKNSVSSMAQAMLDTAMGRGDLNEFVKSRSERMNQRLTVRDRDIMDMSKAWQDKPLLHGISHYAFAVLHYADQAVSLPLWKEVYQKNVVELGPQKAIDMADEAVTRTLGSGSKVDQIGAQRGSGLKKILTMFYGWESVVFNRAWLDGKMSGLEYKKGNIGSAAATMAKATFFAFLLPAVHRALLGELLHSGQQSDSDEKKMIADSFLEEPFAKFPFVRDIAQSLIHTTLGMQGSDYKMSPLEMAYDNILKPVAHDTQSIFGQHGLGLTESTRDFNEKLAEENARGMAQVMGFPQQLNTWTFNFLDYLQSNGEVSMKSFLSRQKMASGQD